KQLDKGTGLGLSQVYGRTRQSGGTVTIASKLGNGTAVTLCLPRSHRPLSERGVTEGDTPRGGEKVLLVEDNPEVQETAGMLLDQLGYRVFRAQSAAAALQLLQSGEAVDLVFSDIIHQKGVELGLGSALGHTGGQQVGNLPRFCRSPPHRRRG